MLQPARKHQVARLFSAHLLAVSPIQSHVMATTKTGSKISINTANTKELTPLPGIAKNLAYRIVNHRNRHGLFPHWEELIEVKEFPAEALDRIKQRATLECPADVKEGGAGLRRIKPTHLEEVKKKPKGYSVSRLAAPDVSASPLTGHSEPSETPCI
jgi:competence ComEA-like helix-hairpin-helix protein